MVVTLSFSSKYSEALSPKDRKYVVKMIKQQKRLWIIETQGCLQHKLQQLPWVATSVASKIGTVAEARYYWTDYQNTQHILVTGFWSPAWGSCLGWHPQLLSKSELSPQDRKQVIHRIKQRIMEMQRRLLYNVGGGQPRVTTVAPTRIQ